MQQDSLLDDEKVESSKGPIECLGQTFKNEEARRAHFTELLREKLKDPEFRKIEGFPIGTDEAILELSDPPYYTACPNPWLSDLVKHWESLKLENNTKYSRDPFATDVSEGKKDPIYTAHSYHTKVPHKAIMRYILHYTSPGDTVYDGFSGTGMTGVAAQLCGNKEEVEALGYRVTSDNIILEKNESLNEWIPISKLGVRNVVLNDLSSIATFISYNYNRTTDLIGFEELIRDKIAVVKEKYGWMYETINLETDQKEELLYCIWSDIFICSNCGEDINFWNSAIDAKGKVNTDFSCEHCLSSVSKKNLKKATKTIYDDFLGEARTITKQVVVEVCCVGVDGQYTRQVNSHDLNIIDKINDIKLDGFPTNKMMFKDKNWGDQWRSGYHFDVTHDYHFFNKRPLTIISALYKEFKGYSPGLFLITATLLGLTRLQRYSPGSTFPNMIRSGTLYIGSVHREWNAISWIEGKVRGLLRLYKKMSQTKGNFAISNHSTAKSPKELGDSLDYIFIDPPFGDNLAYSELNFLWEGWLNVFTKQSEEAIVSKHQKKELDQYRVAMTSCFSEAYRLLKPGRWMTVEFSNSKASVWNSIRAAITESGFIIANVSALDKKQGTFNSITNTTSVKQDLVISAYKPDSEFEYLLQKEENHEKGVWDFISNHLKYLPTIKIRGNEVQFIPERDPRILFDQVVSYYIRNGYSVPISSPEFQIGVSQRFPERDGMVFLAEQVSNYDKKRAISSQLGQLSIFIDDEASSIEWLRQELKTKPKTYSEIHPLFLNEISGWKKNELQLELMTLLEQNFIKYDGNEEVPNQIHTYLSTNFKDMRSLAKDDYTLIAKAKDRWYVPDPSKAGDIEKLRLRALLREFEHYKEEKKKIRQPRAEALRAGFNACWEKQDLQTILDISAKIPPAVLQEDEKLLMFYDNALTLTSNDDDDWD